MPTMVLEQDDDNVVEMEVVRRKWPLSGCSWDSSWLIARVRARVAGASIEYHTKLQHADLRAFLDGLREGPYEGEDGFDLQPLEGGILIFIREIGPRRFRVEIQLSPNGDDRGPHHTLTLDLSRADLDDMARAVEQTILVYPERAAIDADAGGWVAAPSEN
jgi:hypothetical protein